MKALLRNRKINIAHFMIGLPFIIVGSLLIVFYGYDHKYNSLFLIGCSWSLMELLFGGDEE